MQVQSLGWKGPLQKGMATHSSILAWSCGQRSLAGCSPWGRKESGTTEHVCKHIRFIRSVYTIRSRQEHDFSLIDSFSEAHIRKRQQFKIRKYKTHTFFLL